MGPQFFETKMGIVHYQNTMTRIAKSLEKIASVLEEVNKREKQEEEKEEKEEKEESYSEEKEDHDNLCPRCGKRLVVAFGGGVKCPSDECGYWFCQ